MSTLTKCDQRVRPGMLGPTIPPLSGILLRCERIWRPARTCARRPLRRCRGRRISPLLKALARRRLCKIAHQAPAIKAKRIASSHANVSACALATLGGDPALSAHSQTNFSLKHRRITRLTKRLSSLLRPRSRSVACQWRRMRWPPAIKIVVMVAADSPLPDMARRTRDGRPRPWRQWSAAMPAVTWIGRLRRRRSCCRPLRRRGYYGGGPSTGVARSTTAAPAMATTMVDAPAMVFPSWAP